MAAPTSTASSERAVEPVAIEATPGANDDLRTQLRLGVVMTGGVSLAVWMGGVALELDRLRREAPGSVYADLCRLAGIRPVVDIVAGTSAGGLNGTLLASATAWESDLEDLRGVWSSAADFGALLRRPGCASPPSLLDGDGYFLGQARDAIEAIRAKGRSPAATGPARQRAGLPPLHLAVTSTLMQSSTVRLSDSLGAPVSGATHLGLYRFSTDGSAAFDQAGVVAQLARAARSSASFPGAFEASRIDLGGGAVDMASVADFADAGGPASTRYVIDGGLVANEPLDQVYDMIRDQPSQGPVRRVILYVSPLSGVGSVPSSPEFDGPAPDLTQVLAATLMIPREQSIVRSLRAIVDESDERRALSRARRSLQVGPDAAATAELLRAAETLRPVVELQRGRAALAARGAGTEGDAAAEGARIGRRQVLLLVMDLLRRAITRATGPDLVALAGQRAEVSRVLASDLSSDAPVIEVVGAAYEVLAEHVPGVTARVMTSEAPSPPAVLLRDDFGDLQALVAAAEEDAATTDSGATTETAADDDVLAPPTPDARWRALRALDVLVTASSGSLAPDPQRIDLVQMSANTPNCFDGRTSADAKLTGVQLSHFGAFYRGGWRANDWMWGRLDGAFRTSEMLVDPDTLLATGRPVPELAAEIVRIATGPGPSPDHDWLSQQPMMSDAATRVEELLTAVADPTNPDRAGAVERARSQIARMVAARAQLEILREELLHVRTLVAADRETGSALTYADSVFLESARHLDRNAPTAALVEAFRSCLVGQDRLDGELGSDRMTVLGTQGLAVAVGALDTVAGAKRLAVLRPPLKLVRGTFRMSNALSASGFRGSQLAQVVLPMVSVIVAALMAMAIADDSATALQVVLGVALAALSVTALMASLRQAATVVGAVGSIVVLVVGLVIAGRGWSAAPFVGAALAILAAASLAALVLRRAGAPPQPAPEPNS
jgi:predicted acylesterase/phospholipase RssA